MSLSLRKAIHTFDETVKLDLALGASWARAIDGTLEWRGLSSTLRKILYAGTALGGLTMTVVSPLQMLGVASFCML